MDIQRWFDVIVTSLNTERRNGGKMSNYYEPVKKIDKMKKNV